jgi:hypothetical protein
MQSAMAQVNTALTSVFMPTGARCFLGKRDEYSSLFIKIGSELTSGWFIDFDDNRSSSGLFTYADTSANFPNLWAQATHVFYGVPASAKIEVYEFSADEPKDSIDPTGTSPFWSGQIIKVPNERYTIV